MKGIIARFLWPFIMKQLFSPENISYTCRRLRAFFKSTETTIDDTTLIPLIDEFERRIIE